MPWKNPTVRREKRREWYWKNHSASLQRKRKESWKIYGINITLKQWKSLHEKQNGCCAICGVHESFFENALAVDHNHLTGKVRGLLCFICNRYLVGIFEKYEHLIPKVMEYINAGKSIDASPTRAIGVPSFK